MTYETLRLLKSEHHSLRVIIYRPAHRNSINRQLLEELHQVLDMTEENSDYRFIILQGGNNLFCTGMDFHELKKNFSTEDLPSISTNSSSNDFSERYMALLKRFTTTPKVIISLLEGQVLAGGMGIVAASDLVLSNSNSQFGLSEALWGLLPACVMPFLIRRIGFQKAYYLTLTAQTIPAASAYTMGLIDELTEDLDSSLQRHLLRLNRISEETVEDLKTYFQKMWIITEAMEKTAVTEIKRLTAKPKVRANIKNYIECQRFPWETEIAPK